MAYLEAPTPAFLFDLDGTLIDSVYQHVIAWRNALSRLGIELSVWRIHRRIGMSGGLFVSALLRETGLSLSKTDIDRVIGEFGELGKAQRAPGVARRLLVERLGTARAEEVQAQFLGSTEYAAPPSGET